MPINGVNTGRDVTIDVITSQGLVVFDITTSFHPKPVYNTIKSKAMDGITRQAQIPDGHDFTIKIDRASSVTEDYFVQLEADYFAGLPLAAGSISETIQNVDGSISQYRYEGVTLKLDDCGERSGEKLVQMTVSGHATRKIKVQ